MGKTASNISLSFFRTQHQSNPLSELIGARLSPARVNLSETPPLANAELEDTETYIRSEKHPLPKQLGNNAHLFNVSGDLLKNGGHAHYGNYRNAFEMLGDISELQENRQRQTSPGDAVLYDALLNYKNAICRYVAENTKKTQDNLITVNFYNDYPCVMVHIKKITQTLFKNTQTKIPSDNAFEEWVNFLISYFVASLNYAAYKANLPIEIKRQSGFGFQTPSVAPMKESIRINIGLTPIAYADLMIDCLNSLGDLLQNFKLSKNKIPSLPEGTFYQSAEHEIYLANKYPHYALENILQLLWVQVEKKGRTTVQNLMRTAFIREGISAEIFKALCLPKTNLEAFFVGLQWAITRIQATEKKLTVIQEEALRYGKHFSSTPKKIDDPVFWELVKLIIARARQVNNHYLIETLDAIENAIDQKIINKLYNHFEILNELFFVNAIESATDNDVGDGYGSDSETEGEAQGEKLFAKKIITHNGMRAIWAAVEAAMHHLQAGLVPCRLFLDQSYFEISLGLQLIQKINSTQTITKTKKTSQANVILYDLNACATSAITNADYTLLDCNKIVILDATSATTDCVRVHINKFASSRASTLFIVESGFKNQQFGADKNSYGVVRIFTRDKKTREALYSFIKTAEQPIRSKTSHYLRRCYKLFGTVPVTKSFLPQERKPPKLP